MRLQSVASTLVHVQMHMRLQSVAFSLVHTQTRLPSVAFTPFHSQKYFQNDAFSPGHTKNDVQYLTICSHVSTLETRKSTVLYKIIFFDRFRVDGGENTKNKGSSTENALVAPNSAPKTKPSFSLC